MDKEEARAGGGAGARNRSETVETVEMGVHMLAKEE